MRLAVGKKPQSSSAARLKKCPDKLRTRVFSQKVRKSPSMHTAIQKQEKDSRTSQKRRNDSIPFLFCVVRLSFSCRFFCVYVFLGYFLHKYRINRVLAFYRKFYCVAARCTDPAPFRPACSPLPTDEANFGWIK
jgi:hypothetical protein